MNKNKFIYSLKQIVYGEWSEKAEINNSEGFFRILMSEDNTISKKIKINIDT
jgi:hypothetical protein